jgi:hypothetical protein
MSIIIHSFTMVKRAIGRVFIPLLPPVGADWTDV